MNGNIPNEVMIIILNFCGLDQEPLNFKYREGETLRSRAACMMALLFKRGSPIDQYLESGYWRHLVMGWNRISHKEIVNDEPLSNRSQYATLMHKFKQDYKKLHITKDIYLGDYDVKVFLGGKADVGKTALTVQYVSRYFDSVKIEPTIEETTWKNDIVDEIALRMVIEDAMTLYGIEYAHGECFMLVCSITEKQSLTELENILLSHFKKKSYKSYVIIVNKIDLDSSQHEFTLKDVYEIFTRNPKLKCCPVMMISATQNDSVCEAFRILIRFHRIVQVMKSFETNLQMKGHKKCILC